MKSATQMVSWLLRCQADKCTNECSCITQRQAALNLVNITKVIKGSSRDVFCELKDKSWSIIDPTFLTETSNDKEMSSGWTAQFYNLFRGNMIHVYDIFQKVNHCVPAARTYKVGVPAQLLMYYTTITLKAFVSQNRFSVLQTKKYCTSISFFKGQKA